VALAILRKIRADDLVEASRVKGERLQKELTASLGSHPNVGDIRGLGLMVGIEFVADRQTKQPFPRAERVTERLVSACKEDGLLLYSSTASADGTDGDLLMFGPPFVITDEEVTEAVTKTTTAVERVLG
jgi:adenosylmethionine-8-amino-7-oxononanoate aminotransferase